MECGKIKTEMGKKIYDPRREAEVLRGLKKENRGPLREKDLEKIFRTIIEVCRRSQKE
jgi:chorismate mutase/prephenate dehydratase